MQYEGHIIWTSVEAVMVELNAR